MSKHYAVGIYVRGHDGVDQGSMTVNSPLNEEDATRFAEYLMGLSDREILDKWAYGDLGTSEESWVESVFVDRWLTTTDPDESYRPLVWERKGKVTDE